MPAWYSSVTIDQSKTLEKIQRYAVSIILNNWTWSYKVKCTLLSLEPLYLRRPQLALTFVKRTCGSPVHDDFFKRREKIYNTRDRGDILEEQVSRSKRHVRSPLVSLTQDFNNFLKNKFKNK